MRTNFLPILYRQTEALAAAGGGTPVGLITSGLQTAFGVIQTISADAKLKKLLAQRTAYKTPEEYFDILNATQNRAQQGFDAFTLNYLTSEAEKGLSDTLGSATRLGANPNELSNYFENFSRNIMRIGAENQRLNMENFTRYLSALDVIGQNKAAEWKSQQDIIKDKIQAAAADKAAGFQNIGSGLNAGVSAYSAGQTSKLYNEDMFKKIMQAFQSINTSGSGVGPDQAGGYN